LVLHSRTVQDRVFEYDFTIQPGGSLDSVRFNWEGLDGVSVDQQGRLLLQTGGGTVIQDAPVFYQESQGARSSVQGGYVLRADASVGFAVSGDYDRSKPLTIDPTVSFSSYLGGSGTDKGYAITTDAAGDSFVAGETSGSGFPTANGFHSSN